ncbi:ATP-binding protein [Paenibacillus thalictri]|uniref:ATP-binding protein n=1 Tax=Paenibacillus thalictri TaxID=2527873 RepID=UPI0030B87BFD
MRNWDFRNRGLAALDGEWEFYEGQLLEPADFKQSAPVAGMSTMFTPGTWKGKKNGAGMGKTGFGTYRLRVLIPPTDNVMGVKIRSIRMAHTLFINGKQAGGSGVPAADEAAHKPGNTPYSVFFHPGSSEVEIIIQAANYVYPQGGIVNSIQFGLNEDITKITVIQLGSDIAAIFILGMFGAYHLSFYILGRREKLYLYSGLYLLTLTLERSLFGEKLLLRLLPGIPFNVGNKLIDISEFASGAVIVLFFCAIDRRLLKPRNMKLLLAPIVAYIALVIMLPYRLHSEVKTLFMLYLGAVALFLLIRLIYLYGINERNSTNRKELVLFIGGIVSLTVFMTDGLLYTENIVPTDLVAKVGIICFIVFMNMLLAIRFVGAFEKTESLSRQLALSNQLKDEFLTHTSHEIKTPLHGIMNMTSHLLDDEERNLSLSQKQNLWLIKDTSVKLSMLIHDLIDVTRLKHGKLRLKPVNVDIGVLVQIVFDVLQFELLGKEVRLVNEVSADTWVRADENRLRQVLYNLVHNAIKHTSRGLIKVKVVLSGGIAAICVEDTGTGIAEARRETIFEYFEQQHQPLPQDGYTGMGVGLYISRKLVERMGGELRVDWSELGKGTCMRFTLPGVDGLLQEATTYMTEADLQRADAGVKPLDIVSEQGGTILIVDDEASNIHMLLNILKRQQYNVLTAFSADEAMGKMKLNPQIDLVILDVMMPGTSGIELCRMLRSYHSILDLPILFATVKDTPHDIALGFRAGANDYVTKPFEKETLIARIQTLIAMKNSIKEAIRNEQAFHQAQIKPHFLYNALSSVISFCYTDGPKAAHLLTMLSQYLRYILDMDRSTLMVPLRQELELIEAYVEIEKARFGERFAFECHVDPAAYYREIPSLSIQPFVENAIRHGLFEKEGFGMVALNIREGDGFMKVIVEDNGVGIPDEYQFQMSKGEWPFGGIGIPNIRKRLDSIPGASLHVTSERGRGTKVTIYLPVGKSDALSGTG